MSMGVEKKGRGVMDMYKNIMRLTRVEITSSRAPKEGTIDYPGSGGDNGKIEGKEVHQAPRGAILRRRRQGSSAGAGRWGNWGGRKQQLGPESWHAEKSKYQDQRKSVIRWSLKLCLMSQIRLFAGVGIPPSNYL